MYRILLCLLISIPAWSADQTTTDWPTYGLDYTEQRYSPHKEINAGNVNKLVLDWAYDVPDGAAINSTPLVIDGVIYFTADRAIVHALDAATGQPLWQYDPKSWQHAPRSIAIGFNTSRGLAYWGGKIYIGANDGRLIALDAKTGRELWASRVFPEGSRKAINGAPRAYDGKVFIGNSGAEFGNRGYVDAYDANSGKRLWRFYTVPGNPADGFENDAMAMAAKTWHGKWWEQFGGGTVWNALAYDPALNLLYVGTGNGDPWDHQLRSEGKGDNLFLCSIVALRADTGEYVWHYQLNPAEQWDYKATADMILADITHQGRKRQVIMQAPTNGFFYVLDRATGELLSADKYEKATWAERIDLETGRPVEVPGIRMAPGEKQLIYPSPYGAHNWQAMSFNPVTGLAYIPTLRMPAVYWRDTNYEFRENFFTIGMATEYVLSEPDDGTGGLVAYDPVAQEERWRVQYSGVWNGGTLTTAGNLVFHATADGEFYAYRADNGERLWRYDVQRGVTAPPISVAVDGTQRIFLPVGWGGQSSFGPEPFQKHGWKYKGQGIRLLSFSLKGDAALPPADGKRFSFRPIEVTGEPIDSSQAEVGFGIYHQASCAACHGMGVRSTGSAGPDLRESPMVNNFAAFKAVVKDGALLPKSMPRFDDVTDDEVEALFHYVRQQTQIAEDGKQ